MGKHNESGVLWGAFAPEPCLLFLELNTVNGRGPDVFHRYANLPPRSEWSHVSMWLFLSFLQSLLEMSLPQKASSDGFECSSLAFLCVGGGGPRQDGVRSSYLTLRSHFCKHSYDSVMKAAILREAPT